MADICLQLNTYVIIEMNINIIIIIILVNTNYIAPKTIKKWKLMNPIMMNFIVFPINDFHINVQLCTIRACMS